MYRFQIFSLSNTELKANKKFRAFYIRLALIVLNLFIASCNSFEQGSYNCLAYEPKNRNAVSVKVSLSNSAIYVMEGEKPLLVTATCIGRQDTPTPIGTYEAFNKLPRKRSNTYGFHVSGNDVRPGKRIDTPSKSKYVGYPMPCWVEFKAGYGFHTGYVHPVPRTHGCLRIHKNVAPKFFALVDEGTPIKIAESFPEDKTIGKKIRRPKDYTDPDPKNSYMVSDKYFDDLELKGSLFERDS
ncbi:MAG: murein L,D-transpeptidase [Verrucomicrobiaceae bacterium]|nr:MAG: murein L,D-transpeptidase [Verrucomicrobiaceae bacterium]